MANKGAPSGMLSIVDRRCAWSETGSQEKEGEKGERCEGKDGARGLWDERERGMRVFDSC